NFVRVDPSWLSRSESNLRCPRECEISLSSLPVACCLLPVASSLVLLNRQRSRLPPLQLRRHLLKRKRLRNPRNRHTISKRIEPHASPRLHASSVVPRGQPSSRTCSSSSARPVGKELRSIRVSVSFETRWPGTSTAASARSPRARSACIFF